MCLSHTTPSVTAVALDNPNEVATVEDKTCSTVPPVPAPLTVAPVFLVIRNAKS